MKYLIKKTAADKKVNIIFESVVFVAFLILFIIQNFKLFVQAFFKSNLFNVQNCFKIRITIEANFCNNKKSLKKKQMEGNIKLLMFGSI